ncbi:hypothetical protein IVB30_06640 [Bradyrhizobium sp. 200]|uniref:hypothetical protein n=1 Tax=Bradyrhizobium sp. 200 TaxID=2782665 RepID=UPI001FFEA737|nr:hypothetical protein [Bradyrhizobium sp. 200]UPJ51034.1 hypothetical protein IVB30_06640 [Bradyrhizobium sp. 200]
MIRTIWLGFTFLIVMAGVGSFRFAFGHFDAANASGIVHPEVDRAVVTKPPQETSTKADRMRVVAYVSPVSDGTELAKANDVAVELLSRISPAIVPPDIVSRHWQESVPPVIRHTKIQKVKRKQAKNDVITSKSQSDAEPKACQLEEFDAFRWAFSLPTGCHL